MEFPEGNEYTDLRWQLGRMLFFDPIMSRDSSISCASCHLPAYAFSDTVAFSPGVENAAGVRNSPSLANVGYHPYFTREGGVPTLEMQVLVPIQEHNEFDFNIVLIAERLKRHPVYSEMSWDAYDREADHFVISRALGVFERTLISGNSIYDQWAFAEWPKPLPEAAERGRELFFSPRTSCSNCHNGFNFTNYAFENNGLYEKYEDVGRFRLTGDSWDLARFKVPSLRNVSVTGPYMHDGSLETLEEVVEHYNRGGQPHPNKNPLIRELGLTESEKSDLVAFLNTLTDQSFLENESFTDPFK
ncbi:MAG: cytochrome-c peroxidase [Bacteroidetes bacterium]|nr:cytochrome-c peroxidase [Bacteroidota bacterium]